MSDEEIGNQLKRKISDTNDVLSKYFRNHTKRPVKGLYFSNLVH